MVERIRVTKKVERSVETYGTGCTLLDLTLAGGYADGRIVNIIGDKSTGKTLLAIEACANFKIKYGDDCRIRYDEAESAFDLDYAETLGMPVDMVEMVEDIDTVEGFEEDILTFAKECASEGKKGLYVIDSLDALSDLGEHKRDIGDATYGTKAKALSAFFRRSVKKLGKAGVSLIVVSQVRDNIGATFGRKWTRGGGKALDFYASQIFYLKQIKQLKRTVQKINRVTGVEINAYCTKNKVGPPFRECTFRITFGYGIEDMEASLVWLEQTGNLGPLQLTKTKIGPFVKRYKNASSSERKKIDKKVANLVKRVWKKIEKGFEPKVHKYQ
ncbi:hypothetical protein KAR91_02635 [Candidatus Pacearchaeota archaeon]|nr:hypothetical protein [Candidatus Pacearchaeota archaeon]